MKATELGNIKVVKLGEILLFFLLTCLEVL
jgi:hypothetical protein